MKYDYPAVMDERATLDRMVAGDSIARFGDGEWRLAVGNACTSQRAEPGIMAEMQRILRSQAKGFIVGIPNVFVKGAPRQESWLRYCEPQYANLLSKTQTYGSSFITRPDNAPWIDTDDYWRQVRELWRGQDVVLVVGHDAKNPAEPERKSITTDMLGTDVTGARVIIAPRQHAYRDIELIEKAIVDAAEGKRRVLMCLGAAATCLAFRLHFKHGLHALDLGHIGMFMRHAGSYRYAANDLTSLQYRSQLERLHDRRSWGADGAKHAKQVQKIASDMQAVTILDYGCGENKLAEAMKPRRVSGYDPGIPERSKMPKPCDLVVCTDVLEHVEPDKIDAVLDHIFRLTGRQAYLVISTKPANAVLPDGRNAHLIVQPAKWWQDKITAAGFRIGWCESNDKELRVEAVKP